MLYLSMCTYGRGMSMLMLLEAATITTDASTTRGAKVNPWIEFDPDDTLALWVDH